MRLNLAVRLTITFRTDDADRVDMTQNMVELQIKKTTTPMASVNYYSMNMGTPMVPTNISKDNIIDERIIATILDYRTLGMKGTSLQRTDVLQL